MPGQNNSKERDWGSRNRIRGTGCSRRWRSHQSCKAAEEKKESTDEPTNEELEKVLEKLNRELRKIDATTTRR
jgi:uncharacterized FlaG/YvyC family protein